MSDEDYKIYKDHNCARYFYVTVSASNCISNYISYLKENNVYDNTKIILVSDHATPIKSSLFKNDDLEFATGVNAVLIYKDFNSRGEVKIDTNFSTIADLHYLATKHIENAVNPFNNRIITNDYKNNGVNIVDIISWQVERQLSNSYNFNYYYVKDNIFNINNWKKFQIDWKTKESKEIELK